MLKVKPKLVNLQQFTFVALRRLCSNNPQNNPMFSNFKNSSSPCSSKFLNKNPSCNFKNSPRPLPGCLQTPSLGHFTENLLLRSQPRRFLHLTSSRLACAWYFDNCEETDQRDEHKCTPNRPLTLEELKQKTGVMYLKIWISEDGSKYDEEKLDKIRKERGYDYGDILDVSRDAPDFDEKLNKYFIEHLHDMEEIRFCVKGRAFYDVRDAKTDEWIRITFEPGDLIILPPGIYHRFTPDHTNCVKAMRFFIGKPVWTGFNRGKEAEEKPSRIWYVKEFGGKSS